MCTMKEGACQPVSFDIKTSHAWWILEWASVVHVTVTCECWARPVCANDAITGQRCRYRIYISMSWRVEIFMRSAGRAACINDEERLRHCTCDGYLPNMAMDTYQRPPAWQQSRWVPSLPGVPGIPRIQIFRRMRTGAIFRFCFRL